MSSTLSKLRHSLHSASPFIIQYFLNRGGMIPGRVYRQLLFYMTCVVISKLAAIISRIANQVVIQRYTKVELFRRLNLTIETTINPSMNFSPISADR